METRLWQKFWRWIVVMEIVAFGISIWRGIAAEKAYHRLDTKELFARSGALDLQFAMVYWHSAGQMIMLALMFSVAMLAIVELHAWWNRRRDRAELNRYERRASFRP